MTTPRQVHTQLAAASTLLDNLTRRVPAGVGNAQHRARNPDHATEPGIRRRGWISDPTGEQVAAVLTAEDRALDLLDAHLETLRLALAHLCTFADQWAPIIGERTRCHGGRTVDTWSDPGCTNWADTHIRSDGTEVVRGDGLCAACRKRKERWERQRVPA